MDMNRHFSKEDVKWTLALLAWLFHSLSGVSISVFRSLKILALCWYIEIDKISGGEKNMLAPRFLWILFTIALPYASMNLSWIFSLNIYITQKCINIHLLPYCGLCFGAVMKSGTSYNMHMV